MQGFGLHGSVEDPCFMRNHYPRRTVLGIIGRDGAMSQQLRLPAANLHLVPDSISDKEAVFTEPLAAALRILEQKAGSPEPSIKPNALL